LALPLVPKKCLVKCPLNCARFNAMLQEEHNNNLKSL